MKFLISTILLSTLTIPSVQAQSLTAALVKGVSGMQDKYKVVIKDGIPQCKFRMYLYSVNMNFDYDTWGDDEVKISVRALGQTKWAQEKEMNITDGKHREFRVWKKQPSYFWSGDLDEYKLDIRVQEQNGGGGWETIVPAKPIKYGSDDISPYRFEKHEALKLVPADFGARDRTYKKNTYSTRFGDRKVWKTITQIDMSSWLDNDLTNEDGEKQSWAPDAWQGPQIQIKKVSNCTVDQVTKYVEARNDESDKDKTFSDDREVIEGDDGNWTLSDL